MTATSARPARDLLSHRGIAAFVRSRWYPTVFQVPVAAVFGLVAYELLLGPSGAHDNAGTALMWVLWWPLVPLTFLLLGRFWCAVCPFATLSDLVQKAVGLNRPVPRFLKVYGIWVIDAAFLAITWADHVWGVVGSPWGSGVLLLLLTTAVVVSGAFFQRRTFCRYLCFLGGLSGNYSRAGMLQLRADPDVCATCTARAACYNGTATTPPCPLFSFPRQLDSMANCNLCASCVKSCPNDAITITVRPPARELWLVGRARLEESFLAMAIMGIVLIQNVTMLSVWQDALDWIERTTGITSYPVIFTAAFLVAVSLPVLLLTVAAWVAAPESRESVRQNFARFGYALIPLDVAAHVAHNLFHLLAEGKAVVFTLGGLIGSPAGGSTAVVGQATISVLQYALLAAGLGLSVLTGHRISVNRHGAGSIARSVAAPTLVLVLAFGALNAVLFALPMAHRM
ncbi:4Fe-4S binding protein [Nocardioides pocheonensis]|uniref:4Fe-4S binding protein n=1 Tax=Nocardioides pocheonensis TaxID=661485 RepID=UPI00160D1BBB|nr:4Fe-4S binding protein [Nocardioides pocheonensis]